MVAFGIAFQSNKTPDEYRALEASQSFCLYALQATIPLLPAKQRATHPNDWMTTDARVICPDPLCGVVMVIERTGRRTLRHQDVSAAPLEPEPSR